jgi:hypothetical protein
VDENKGSGENPAQNAFKVSLGKPRPFNVLPNI